jgi:hypothetical protein
VDVRSIPARMFVTDPLAYPGCLAGHPTVVTAAPWELVGQFLTGEMDSSRGQLFQHLPRFLRECAEGIRSEYIGGTEGFDLEIRGHVVRLETVYADPPGSCEIPLDLFQDLLERWRMFVRNCERGR